MSSLRQNCSRLAQSLLWRELRDIPNQAGFACILQQTNAAGNLEEVLCTVRKDEKQVVITSLKTALATLCEWTGQRVGSPLSNL